MQKDNKIYIAGHRGMVGSAIMRRLQQDGFHNIITRTSKELDLRSQEAVADFFADERPQYVFPGCRKSRRHRSQQYISG